MKRILVLAVAAASLAAFASPAGAQMAGAQPAAAPMPGVISQTKPAGPYTITLNLLPAEAFLSAADAAKTHATEGMVVVGGAPPVPPDAASHPNHHLVAHIYRADGSAVQGAHPAITYALATATPATLPIVEMQAAGMGPKSTHYGNNVTLAPGTYTVVVTVEAGATATFSIVVP